jgi:hypothetical protein
MGAVGAMAVSFRDLLDAVEFAGFDENRAILCKATGKIYWRSEFSDLDERDESLPDDIDDGESCIALPDRRELGLGKPLVLDFARDFLPRDFDEVRSIFSRRGAYRKFRDLLARRNAVQRWHDFEAQATERALREWCERNSIAVID